MLTGYLNREWFARENDLIGGWCVMPVIDEPPSWGVPEVADFTTREIAEHIADIHNTWLKNAGCLDKEVLCRRDILDR